MKEIIDSLASESVFLDKDDTKGMKDMLILLEKLAAIAEDDGGDFVAELSKSGAEYIKNVISKDEYSNADLDVINRMVFTLQTVLESGEDAARAMAPSELVSDSGMQEQKEFYENIDEFMIVGFIAESRERLEKMDQHLLSLESDPKSEEILHAMFRVFHTIKGDAGIIGYNDMSVLAHSVEDLLALVRCGELYLSSTSLNMIFEAVDVLRQHLSALEKAVTEDVELDSVQEAEELIDRIKSIEKTGGWQRLGEILVDAGHITPEILVEVLELQGAEVLDKEISSGINDECESEKRIERRKEAGRRSSDGADAVFRTEGRMIRIETERLDLLLDAIGELGIASSMVSQDESLHTSATDMTIENLSLLDKITHEILEIGSTMRMTPIRSTFNRMERLVHDLAQGFGKNINFIVKGKETEMDRAIVEKIGELLIHLVRNSIDHGIEDVDIRAVAQKAEKGTIQLSAFHEGGNVYIEISDDGGGLDSKKIIAKAKERGMISEDINLSDRAVFNLIFEPGFSTAEEVTDVSGRGVGMDVVRQGIESLRGKISISSEPGKGTKVSIALPLTMTNIEGIVVKVTDERYIIPINYVNEVVRSEGRKIVHLGDVDTLDVRGELLPFPKLAELLKIPTNGSVSDDEVAVIVETNGKRVALHVDELLGQKQFVVKKLSEMLSKEDSISGTVIMPDGAAAFVLDVNNVVHEFTG